jgi:hypothetical protein
VAARFNSLKDPFESPAYPQAGACASSSPLACEPKLQMHCLGAQYVIPELLPALFSAQ